MNHEAGAAPARMKMDELYRLTVKGLPSGHAILDVRDRDEYSDGRVKGSLNVPAEDVLGHVAELARYERLYVHCGGGGRAGRAVQALAQAGLTNLVHICDSGFRSWREAGYPIDR